MAARRVFCIMPAAALPYAYHAVATLLTNALEDVALTVITDSAADKREIDAALAGLALADGKSWTVIDKEAADQRAAERFAGRPNLLAFRDGHPCWRKITDPLLFSAADEEIIILDPDLYFPNRFVFEPTPEHGLLLMRQGPNCLYPPAAVERAFASGAPLADHVDIGVAQLRCGALDLDWLEVFIGALGVADFAAYMHIEAIIWAAAAMRMGGGHYDPTAWRCWQRGQVKRLAIAAGAPGPLLLRLEPLSAVKCIHVSGPSKWWVVDAVKKGSLKAYDNVFDAPTPVVPYVEYTREKYNRDRQLKTTLRKLGYYRLTKSG